MSKRITPAGKRKIEQLQARVRANAPPPTVETLLRTMVAQNDTIIGLLENCSRTDLKGKRK